MTSMTDEEKWEEYLSKRICKSCSKVCEGDCDYANPNKQSYLDGFDEGYQKATERAYERQQDLTDIYIKDGEKIKFLEKENAELKALIPQWHDLRKNPDDLPTKEDITIRCVLSNGNEVICKTDWYEPAEDEIGYGKIIIQFYCNDDWIDTSDVIAWCEIPKFEEED